MFVSDLSSTLLCCSICQESVQVFRVMIDILHDIIYSKDIPKLKLSLATHYEPKMVRFSPPPKHTKKEVNEINGYMFFSHKTSSSTKKSNIGFSLN